MAVEAAGRQVAAVDRDRLSARLEHEVAAFRKSHPRSLELSERSRSSLLFGVPMSWMARWAGGFPVFVQEAKGARVVDVDGHEYVDLCLGDTGAMAGHSPEPVVQALAAQAARGSTAMLPTEDAAWVGGAGAAIRASVLAVRSDGDGREPLRPAIGARGDRPSEGARLRLVLPRVGRRGARGDAGRRRRPARRERRTAGSSALTTKVVQFNDLDALEEALRAEDVACVLAEPALTNIGIVLPDDGFHEALRELTRKTGTLLAIDETHTLSAGPGGCTKSWSLEPDIVTVGKAIGGRDARCGVRRHGRAWPSGSPSGPRPTTRTRAGSAARWPGTPSRSRPSARHSSTCSPKTRSRARSRSPSASRRTCPRRSRTRPSPGT